MNPLVKTHTSKNQVWTNAAGDQVPAKFLTAADKQRELVSAKIRTTALSVEKHLANLHQMMSEANAAIALAIREEYQLKQGKQKQSTKGNLTWYNFDNSIKVEVNLNDIVKWDDAVMTEALSLLNKYIDSALSNDNILIKKLVNDAFSNSKGTIDSKKVFQLLKYEGQIRNSNFNKACELMRSAQRIDKTKLYMQVWERMEDGSYRNINLNFSSL